MSGAAPINSAFPGQYAHRPKVFRLNNSQSTGMHRITAISIPILLACGLLRGVAPLHVSPRDYLLQGELTYSFFKGTNRTTSEKLHWKVLRSGDRLRIATAPLGSDFPASKTFQ